MIHYLSVNGLVQAAVLQNCRISDLVLAQQAEQLEQTPEKKERFQREIDLFRERYEKLLKAGDPYYNPNLSLVQGDCSLRLAYETVKGNEK